MILGTAGHVDHGKTALVKALTGVDTDRLPEERRRGLTIELGFAPLDLPGVGRLGVVDVPGHEKFIPTMLSGCAGMDLVLLAVAADQGPMPQTREHLDILSLLGVRGGVVALTRADLAGPERLEETAAAVATLLRGTFLEGGPAVPVSVLTGRGLEELRQALAREARRLVRPPETGAFRLHVDRVFSVAGSGTVVTGTLTGGPLARGDRGVLWPGGLPVRVRGLQSHGTEVSRLESGCRAAVNLAGVEAGRVGRGDTLAPAGALTLTRRVDVWLKLTANAPFPVRNDSLLHLHHGGRNLVCRCVLLGRDRLEPGEEGYAQLRLEEELAAAEGDPFVVRFFSPLATLGGGRLLELDPPKRGRMDPARLADLEVLAHGTPEEAAALRLERAGERPLRPGDPAPYRAAGGLEGADWFLSPAGGAALWRRAEEAIRMTPGLGRGELREKLFPHTPRRGAEALLGRVLELGGLDPAATRLTLPGPAGTEGLEEAVAACYRRAGLAAPQDREAEAALDGPRDGVRLARRRLTERGALTVLAPGYRVWTAALRAGEAELRAAFGGAPFTLAQARDRLGVSRRYALLVLERWDRDRVTQKIGEARVFL